MLPARMRSAERKPVISISAVKPSPVPKVRQSHVPSSVQAEAIMKPSPHSFMALVPLTLSRIRLPSASVYQLDTLEDSRVFNTSIMPSRLWAGIEPFELMTFARSYSAFLLLTVSAMPVIWLMMLSRDTPLMLVRSLVIVMASFSGASKCSTSFETYAWSFNSSGSSQMRSSCPISKRSCS